MLRTSRNTTIVGFLYLLIALVLFLVLRGASAIETVLYIRICTLISLSVFVTQLLYIRRRCGTWFNSIVLFLLSFYLFQNGQLLLKALGVEFADYYFNLASSYIKEISLFTAVSNIVAGAAGLLVSKPVYQSNYIEDSAGDNWNYRISSAAKIGMGFTALVAVPLVIYKFILVISGGYYLVRSFEGTVPSLVSFIEYMFVPFSILTLLYLEKKRSYNFGRVVLFLWALLTALTGDRTSGVAGMLILLYINEVKKSEKSRKRHFLIIVAGIVGLILLTRIASAFRSQNDLSSVMSGSLGVLSDFVSELGFSFFPLYMVMTIMPSREPFMLGRGYLSAFISGCIPSFIDPTGIIRKLERVAHSNSVWQESYFSNYNFGFGYSLNAEAYSNFGWGGLIALFFVCIVIFHFLQRKTSRKESYKNFNIYMQCVLIFVWITLPRRDTYYLWKGLVYCILFIRLYLRLFVGKSYTKEVL